MKSRVEQLEKAVQNLGRRAAGRVIAVAPPAIVSYYTDKPASDGTLCAFVSPFKATVKVVAFSMLDSQLAKDAEVSITYIGAMTSTLKIPLKRTQFVEDVEYQLEVGDTVMVGINHPDMVQKISISLMLELEDRTAKKIRVRMQEIADERV